MKLKNVFLIVFAVSSAVLLASNLQTRSDYVALKDEAMTFRQDCQWFSMDVVAVDAETGEPVARAFLDHRAEYPMETAAQISFPRLSRVYSPEEGCTKVSGIADEPLRLVMSAPDYQEAEFEIVPDRSSPNQPTLIVELERKSPRRSPDKLYLSQRAD